MEQSFGSSGLVSWLLGLLSVSSLCPVDLMPCGVSVVMLIKKPISRYIVFAYTTIVIFP